MKLIKFYPYAHTVTDRILSIQYSEDSVFNNIENRFIKIFNNTGIKAYRDNKIVFEVEKNGKRIFYGFYDWIYSVGYNVRKI